MKYGEELHNSVFAPWRLSYISYDVLKQELKSRQLDHAWNSNDEAVFVHLLENELTKVYEFVNAKLGEIDARILYCERTIQTLQKNPTINSDANYDIMDEALTEILFDVNDLSKFTRVNFTAIQKILKKHDKWTGLDLKQNFVKKLRDKPLDKQRFEVAYVYISALHDLCRNRGKEGTGNSASGGDQNAFERATAKYWVHPDNISEVKAIILLHLPVLIFNKDKKYEAADSAISSVYYDNNNFDLYTGRLQRDEEAEAIRFRWYGPYETKAVFIERKTHHAPWNDGVSVKERFPLEEGRVNDFVSGKLTARSIASELKEKNSRKNIHDQAIVDNVDFIATGVQRSFKEKKLESMIRVFYNRTAFQIAGDQTVRLSLDTDLTFIREDEECRRAGDKNWRRQDVHIDHPFNHVQDHEILRFPYAVLETKIQTNLGAKPPVWLTNLLESHLVHEVPRFSKYLHGACHFYSKKLALLPWWLSEMNTDIRKGRVENAGLTRSRSFKPLIDGRYRRADMENKERKDQAEVIKMKGSESSNDSGKTVNGRRNSIEYDEKQYQPVKTKPKLKPDTLIGVPVNTDPVSPNGKSIKKVKVRVEPKTFFANERTFISWLQFCALLLTVALSLVNFGDNVSRIVGGIFMGLSAAIAVYALYRFEKRAWMINRQIDGRYDDLWGPAVLCILLVAALIVNFYLRFRPQPAPTVAGASG